jgi:hypothetical protein
MLDYLLLVIEYRVLKRISEPQREEVTGVGFEVLTAVSMKIAVFWRFALMMEAARTSETLVNFYQTTRCYNPEDSNLQVTGGWIKLHKGLHNLCSSLS